MVCQPDRPGFPSLFRESSSRNLAGGSHPRHAFGSGLDTARLLFSRLAVPLLILAGAFLLYFQTWHYPFQFDDSIFLEDGNVLAHNWKHFLFPPVPRAFSWLSYLFQIGQGTPLPDWFRFVNILLHGLNAVLVWLLCRKLMAGPGAEAGALVAALIFLAHPLQSEPVIYIYQRSTLLSSTFFLLSLLLALRDRAGIVGDALLVVCGTSALLCKEWTIILPGAIWLVRGLGRNCWKPGVALTILGLFSLLAVVGMLLWLPSEPTLGTGSSWDYARAQAWAWWRYLQLILFPIGQSVDPALPAWAGSVSAILPTLGLLGFFGVLIWWWRQRPRLLLGVALFVLPLLPTSSFVPAQDPLFEHRLYAAMLGVSLLVGEFAVLLWEKQPQHRLKLAAGAILLVAAFSLATVIRSRDWRSQESLWRGAVEEAPDKYRPRLNLGRLLMDSRPAEAAGHLIQAIQLRPDLPQAYRSLAALRLKSGRRSDAAELWRQALLLDPDDAPTHLALGQLWTEERNYFAARAELQKAIQADPSEIRAYRGLARLELNFGFMTAAREVLDRALANWPRDPELVRLRARTLFRLGLWQPAAEAYEESLRLSGPNWQDLVQAGQAQQNSGDPQTARAYFQQALVQAENSAQRSITQDLLERLK